MKLMTISQKGVDFIKKFENCKLQAYQCSAGVWTIGYGHTRGVTKEMTITQDIAEKLLVEDIRPIETLLNGMGVNFRQGQFDALVSLVFNIGIGAFNNSTLKKLILKKADDAIIMAEFEKWNKATVNGKKTVLAGLTRRRREEAAMWKQ